MGTSDEWLSPPDLVAALGEFDLDPCTPEVMPWLTALNRFTRNDDGLVQQWRGRVWMNPPYSMLLPWMHKLATHGDGIALIPVKTETKAFQYHVFPKADSIFFFHGRLKFYLPTGVQANVRTKVISCLVSYGEHNAEAIEEAGFKGAHTPLNRIGIVVAGYDMTWQLVLKTVFIRLNKPATLEELYDEVEALAPDKIRKNAHFKAKIRQTVQYHFKKVSRGVYTKE